MTSTIVTKNPITVMVDIMMVTMFTMMGIIMDTKEGIMVDIIHHIVTRILRAKLKRLLLHSSKKLMITKLPALSLRTTLEHRLSLAFSNFGLPWNPSSQKPKVLLKKDCLLTLRKELLTSTPLVM